MSASCKPYIDTRHRSRPFVVTLRSATGGFVEYHRFADERDAWAFYLAHR